MNPYMRMLSFLSLGLLLSCSAGPRDSTSSTSILPSTSIVLGQPSGTEVLNYKLGMNGPVGGLVVGTKLFVADTLNNRVLIWNSLPTTNHQAPDLVLGQPDFSTLAFSNASATRFSEPYGLASDGTHLVVSDLLNNRVLIWNSIPTTNDQPADVVIGQPDMASNSSGTAQNALTQPEGVAISGSKLIVADTGNSRVLIFNTIPTSNQANADVVLGQPDFVSALENAGGTVAANTFDYPTGVAVSGSKLIVSDYMNNRVLIFNTIPSINQPNADTVIGQPDMISNSANAGSSEAANTLYGPMGIAVSASTLAVADYTNSRVLIYNTVPTSNQAPADAVIGEPDMLTTPLSPACTAATASAPIAIWFGSGHLYYSDQSFSRVLEYSSTPASNGVSADLVLGQDAFNTAVTNAGPVSASNMGQPFDVMTDGTRVLVADYSFNRILIWNKIPTASGASADVVLGQASMTEAAVNRGGSAAANTLSGPEAVTTDGTHVAVADTANNRVLLWNSIPSGSGVAADVVLGQSGFTLTQANQGSTPTSQTLASPVGVAICSGKLVVSESMNNRVLIWNSIPTTNDKAADVVLGQPDMTHSGINRDPSNGFGTLGNDGMHSPSHVTCQGGKLFVADTANNRVLIYNSIPTVSGAAADLEVGQPGFTTNSGGATASAINGPEGVFFDGTSLFTAEWLNNRVLGWRVLPSSSGAAADSVVGQSSLTATLAPTSPSLTGISQPMAVSGTTKFLLIADYAQYRVLLHLR